MEKLVFISIIIFLILYIVHIKSQYSELHDLQTTFMLFDNFIQIYGNRFVSNKSVFDMISKNRSLSEEEFFEIRESFVKFIWDNLPTSLKKKLRKNTGLDVSIKYILNKIDPILSQLYRVNKNLEYVETEQNQNLFKDKQRWL